jgi:hypothetical protein
MSRHDFNAYLAGRESISFVSGATSMLIQLGAKVSSLYQGTTSMLIQLGTTLSALYQGTTLVKIIHLTKGVPIVSNKD